MNFSDWVRNRDRRQQQQRHASAWNKVKVAGTGTWAAIKTKLNQFPMWRKSTAPSLAFWIAGPSNFHWKWFRHTQTHARNEVWRPYEVLGIWWIIEFSKKFNENAVQTCRVPYNKFNYCMPRCQSLLSESDHYCYCYCWCRCVGVTVNFRYIHILPYHLLMLKLFPVHEKTTNGSQSINTIMHVSMHV